MNQNSKASIILGTFEYTAARCSHTQHSEQDKTQPWQWGISN